MSKRRNVAYVKPEEPTFLRRLKERAGYVEGPTVDTKKEQRAPADEEDLRDAAEELPAVVVLRPGDLTAEEAAAEERRIREEADEKPADLSERIVFKPRKPKTSGNPEQRPSGSKDGPAAKKAKKPSLLSFEDESEEERDS